MEMAVFIKHEYNHGYTLVNERVRRNAQFTDGRSEGGLDIVARRGKLLHRRASFAYSGSSTPNRMRTISSTSSTR